MRAMLVITSEADCGCSAAVHNSADIVKRNRKAAGTPDGGGSRRRSSFRRRSIDRAFPSDPPYGCLRITSVAECVLPDVRMRRHQVLLCCSSVCPQTKFESD